MITDITAFLTVLQSFGIEVGKIIESIIVLFVSIVFVAWMSKKYVWPKVSSFFDSIINQVSELKDSMSGMKDSVIDLNKTLQEHIVQTDLRMDAGEKEFQEIKTELQKIKTHIGIE